MTIQRIDRGGEIRVKRDPDFKSPSANVTTGAFMLGDIKEFVLECELAGAMDNTIVIANQAKDPNTDVWHCSYLGVQTELGLPKVAEPKAVVVPWRQNPRIVAVVVSMVWLLLFLLGPSIL